MKTRNLIAILMALTLGVLMSSSVASGISSLDTAFNRPYGYAIYGHDVSDSASASAIQPDGKIVLAGSAFNGVHSNLLIIRLNGDGSMDGSFGNKGAATYGNGYDNYGFAMTVRSNGKILVAGCSYNGRNYDVLLVQFNSNGTLDSTFGTGGVVSYTSGVNNFGYALSVQLDGKIVVAGQTHNGMNYDVLLLRFNSNGTLDGTFGKAGVVAYDSGNNDYGCALSIQQDGKIVVAGITFNGINNDVLLLRFNTSGTLDTTFGKAGVATYDSGRDDSGLAVALQQDGKIVVAGSTFNGVDSDVLLLRFNTSGTLDRAFGKAGVVTYNHNCNEYAVAVAMQPDGTIVVASNCFNDTNYSAIVLTYNGDGTLCGSYGVGCTIATVIGGYAFVNALALQQDGKILISGARVAKGEIDLFAARVIIAADVLPTFSISGRVLTVDMGTPTKPKAGMGTPTAGVTITLAGPISKTTVTDLSGNYTFAGLANGSYTVTPVKSGLAFNPNSRSVIINGASIQGQDFSGSNVFATFAISGTVFSANRTPLAGTTIMITGAATGATITDARGNYTFTGLVSGNYALAPSTAGFTPVSRNVFVSGTNVTGQNFTKNP